MNTTWLWAWKIVLWLLVVFFVLLLVVLPLTTSILVHRFDNIPPAFSTYLSWSEMIQRHAMRALVAVWVFYVGCCFASFLNVVAWRVPRGRTILGSSKCPHCNVKLNFRDNVPIVGWLKTGGRCRTCRLPISPRYLIVEIVLGTIFLLVVSSVLGTGGATLPIRNPNPVGGLELNLLDPRWDLVQITCFHLALICFLFTHSLIELDGDFAPRSIAATGAALALVLSAAWPRMWLVNWDFPFANAWPVDPFSLDVLLNWFVGGFIGANCGFALAWMLRRLTQLGQLTGDPPTSPPPNDSVAAKRDMMISKMSLFSLILVGVFLGWQSVVVVTAIAGLLSVGYHSIQTAKVNKQLPLEPRLPVAGIVSLACLIHLGSWRWFNWLASWVN